MSPVSRVVCSKIVVIAVAVMNRMGILVCLPPERERGAHIFSFKAKNSKEGRRRWYARHGACHQIEVSNDCLLPWKWLLSKGIYHQDLTEFLAHPKHAKWYGCVVGADMVRNGVLVHGSNGGGHHKRQQQQQQQQQQESTLFSSVSGGSQNALPRGWADRRLPFWGVSSSVQPVIIIAYTISGIVYTI
jgi:hypothetical protein